jgi:SH3 domain-containing YSC84-like protein 1
MKNVFTLSLTFLVLTIMVLAATSAFAVDLADRQKDDIERLNDAGTVLSEIMSAPDKGIPEEIIGDAKCIAVVPALKKGGFVFGGGYGKGVTTCRTGSGWSAPAFFVVDYGSFGLQIGGQEVDLVMVVMNDSGMNQMLKSKFKLGANASVAAGPVGRHAEGMTDWKLRAQILTYSRARGLFAGLELNGASIRQDKDDTRAYYGRMVPYRTILTGEIGAPASAQPFTSVVAKYAGAAKPAGQNAAKPAESPAPTAETKPAEPNTADKK